MHDNSEGTKADISKWQRAGINSKEQDLPYSGKKRQKKTKSV